MKIPIKPPETPDRALGAKPASREPIRMPALPTDPAGNEINPAAPSVDYAKVFMTFVACLGDVAKTAVMTGLDKRTIRELAKRDNWERKVEQLRDVKATQGAEAFAREINRTTNFVQAVRCRNVLDRVIEHVTGGTSTFEEMLSTVSATGMKNFTSKPLLELMKSIETVQRMTYAALGDTASERVAAAKGDDGPTDANPSLAMYRALTQLKEAPINEVPGSETPREAATPEPVQVVDRGPSTTEPGEVPGSVPLLAASQAPNGGLGASAA